MPGTVAVARASVPTNESSRIPANIRPAPADRIGLAPSRSYNAPATNETSANVAISGSSASPASSGE